MSDSIGKKVETFDEPIFIKFYDDDHFSIKHELIQSDLGDARKWMSDDVFMNLAPIFFHTQKKGNDFDWNQESCLMQCMIEEDQYENVASQFSCAQKERSEIYWRENCCLKQWTFVMKDSICLHLWDNTFDCKTSICNTADDLFRSYFEFLVSRNPDVRYIEAHFYRLSKSLHTVTPYIISFDATTKKFNIYLQDSYQYTILRCGPNTFAYVDGIWQYSNFEELNPKKFKDPLFYLDEAIDVVEFNYLKYRRDIIYRRLTKLDKTWTCLQARENYAWVRKKRHEERELLESKEKEMLKNQIKHSP